MNVIGVGEFGFSIKPPSDTIRAVKVTKDNIQYLAKYVLESGAYVSLGEDNFSIGDDVYYINDWIVEGYNYETNRPEYYAATLEERKKYDLR